MKYSKETLEKFLTPSQKKVVKLALDKLAHAYSDEARMSQEVFKVWTNLYKEDIFILEMFNEFINWDKLCKYCFDNGINFTEE